MKKNARYKQKQTTHLQLKKKNKTPAYNKKTHTPCIKTKHHLQAQQKKNTCT